MGGLPGPGPGGIQRLDDQGAAVARGGGDGHPGDLGELQDLGPVQVVQALPGSRGTAVGTDPCLACGECEQAADRVSC